MDTIREYTPQELVDQLHFPLTGIVSALMVRKVLDNGDPHLDLGAVMANPSITAGMLVAAGSLMYANDITVDQVRGIMEEFVKVYTKSYTGAKEIERNSQRHESISLPQLPNERPTLPTVDDIFQ